MNLIFSQGGLLVKTFLALTTLIATLSTSAFALQTQSVDLNKTYISSLNNFQMDMESSSLKTVRAGYVQLLVSDKQPSTILLTMYRPYVCPTGKMCAMMMPVPVSVRMQIKNVTTDSCNAVSYFAIGNTSDGSGTVQKLTVVDNSSSTCQAPAPTVITYEIDTPRGETSISHMTGDQLRTQTLDQIQIQ
jgi:hypothetical protein